jgi:hypothetical protein
LINDRLEEALWLSNELKDATDTDRIFDGYISRSQNIEVHTKGLANDVASGKTEATKPGTIAFDEEFRLRSAVRDQIRQQILENQLDDRHDLYGNSLYVLKFDTTIIPTSKRSQKAFIRIGIDIPQMYAAVRGENDQKSLPTSAQAITYFKNGPEKLQEWIDLFGRWRVDVATRLDESVAKESEGFSLGHWKAADYDELREYILSRLTSLTDQPEILEGWRRSISTKDEFLKLVSDSALVQAELSRFVSEFFGDRALRLVLGIQTSENMHEGDLVKWSKNDLLYRVDPLASYVDIHMLAPRNLGEAPDFDVQMRWDRIYVTDGKCTQDNPAITSALNNTPNTGTNDSRLRVSMFDRWVDKDKNVFADAAPQYRLTSELYQVIRNSARPGDAPGFIQLSPSNSNVALKNCTSIDLVSLPSGLFNFIDKIARADLYSYAVLPRQSVRATVSEILNRVSVTDLELGPLPTGAKPSLNAGSNELRSGTNLRATVTSFAATGKYGDEPEDKPEFGWIVDPSSSAFAVGEIRPVSESMMAIVSVPAWWEELHLTVETGWISGDGEWVADKSQAQSQASKATPDSKSSNSISGKASPGEPPSISVVLPNSYEGIDAFLMQVKRRKPVIVEADFEQNELTACAPANLLIRGNRLWRNSVVTLGSQEADTIRVMPNMDGILAKFDSVSIPHELTGSSGIAKLRVWTSEGMAELRQAIRVTVPTAIDPTLVAVRQCTLPSNKALSTAAKAN